MATGNYRALVGRTGISSNGSALHLIRDDAEASLCGVPRRALGPGARFNEIVCPECLEWLPKRMEASRKLRRVASG